MRATTIRGQNALILLHHRALRRFHVTDSQNTLEQITISNTMTDRIAKTPKIDISHDSSLGRHVNAVSRKSLEIQAYSITKRKPFRSLHLHKLYL